MIDFVSKTDELEHRMDFEDARLEIVEERDFRWRSSAADGWAAH